MKREEIKEKAAVIIEGMLGCPPDLARDENARIVEDLTADSLDQIEMIMAVEEEFNVSFDDAEADELRTVGAWIDALVEKLE